jgi:hypothetical protein
VGKSFRITATAELPEWANEEFGKRDEIGRITADCVLRVCDPDGESDSWLINVDQQTEVVIEWTDDDFIVLPVSALCVRLRCSHWKIGNILASGTASDGADLNSLAQHLWIYSRDAIGLACC